MVPANRETVALSHVDPGADADVPLGRSGGSVVHRVPLAERHHLLALRLRQRPGEDLPPEYAAPLPDLPEVLLRQAWHRDGEFQDRLQIVGVAIYIMATGLKGTSSMKLAPRPGHLAEEHLARGASHPAELRGEPGPVRRAGGGGRVVLRPRAAQPASRRAPLRRSVPGRQAGGGWREGPRHQPHQRWDGRYDPSAGAAGLRRGASQRLGRAPHGRSGELPGPAEPHRGQGLERRVRQGPSPHQRHGVLLVDDEAGLLRHLPPNEPASSAMSTSLRAGTTSAPTTPIDQIWNIVRGIVGSACGTRTWRSVGTTPNPEARAT